VGKVIASKSCVVIVNVYYDYAGGGNFAGARPRAANGAQASDRPSVRPAGVGPGERVGAR